MGYPALDIALTKNPIAFVITPAKKISIRKLKLISGPFFRIKEYGVFMLDPTKAIPLEDGRNNCYLFDCRNGRPFDWRYLKELEDFGKHNALHKIRRKDVRQGGRLRSLMAGGKNKHDALEDIRSKEKRAQDTINDIISNINNDIQKQMDLAEKAGDPEKIAEIKGSLNVDEYSSVIIDALITENLIEPQEGFALKLKLIKGKISVEEFIKQLNELKFVEINQPISMELEKVIQDFHTYEPAIVDAFIDRGEKIGEKIKKMGTPAVKNFMPIMYIMIIMIVAIVLGVTFQGLDFSHIKLPSLFPPKETAKEATKLILGLFLK